MSRRTRATAGLARTGPGVHNIAPRGSASSRLIETKMISRKRTTLRFDPSSSAWIGLRVTVVSNRYVYPLYAELERKHKLLRDDVAVINCLTITSATTAQEIVRYTGRPKNSISRAVAKLEAQGVLLRKAHLRDGRASTLHLTSRGKKLFAQIEHFFAELDQRLIEVLSEKEKKEFNRLLNKISEASADWT
jgi:DNA-binding MarR family transcriptional regulator